MTPPIAGAPPAFALILADDARSGDGCSKNKSQPLLWEVLQ